MTIRDVQNVPDRHKRKRIREKGIYGVKVIKRYKPISAKTVVPVHADSSEPLTIGCRPSSFGYLVDVQA